MTASPGVDAGRTAGNAVPPLRKGAAEPAPHKQRTRLGVRIAMVTTAVALLSTLVAAGLSFGLNRHAAEGPARRQLARQATLVAGLVTDARTPARVRSLLQAQGIRLVLVRPDGTTSGRAQLAAADLGTLAAGRPVSRVETIDGTRSYVEGRLRAQPGAVVLVQSAKLAPRDQTSLLRRGLLALVIGLAVAVLAGLLLAWRISRPLQQVAAAARRLAGGARDVRLRPDGAAEVAEVATSVNELAGALQASEARQRAFLMSVSHELRTPLTAIAGFAESLADGVTPAEQAAPTGRLLVDQAARLQRLIDDLLTLARLQADDFSLHLLDVDGAALLADLAMPWRARCGAAGVRFAVEVEAGPLRIRTDPVRLRQVLDALLDNAVRLTPAGAPVVLAMSGRADGVRIEVRDGGPGLADADLPYAFEPGALHGRTSSDRRGAAGLGLAIVARLTGRLGGTVGVGRAPEGGARFTVWLPRSPVPVGRPPELPMASG